MSEALPVHEHLERWLAARPESRVATLARDHLAAWRPKLDAGFVPVAIVLPTIVGGGRVELVPVAAATWAFFLGIDLLDNVNDRELDERWARHGALAGDLATLAAVGLIQAAPLVASESSALAPREVAEVATLFATAYWEMAEGQVEDLATEARDPADAAERYELLAARKSGAHLRLFASVAAVAAGAREARPALERYAESLALAGQIASDLDDLFAHEVSRDVVNAKATWPLARAAAHLRESDPGAHARFLELLARLRDVRAHATLLPELREMLVASGAVTATTLRVEMHLRRAREALAHVRLADTSADTSALERLLDEVSPFARLRRASAP